MFQFLVDIDCLNEIFEYLEEDRNTLHSCLLVNRLWCEIAVRILWRDSQYYSTFTFRTLIACLPNESKEVLHKNGIIIPPPTSKPPIFNYASFCKTLADSKILIKICQLFQQFSLSENILHNILIVEQEIYKLFMKQISSLKTLNVLGIRNANFTNYPGAENCLKNLSELHCNSYYTCPDFFYQLSQICHDLQILSIKLEGIISDGLADLISVQKNLKWLKLTQYFYCTSITDIIPSLTKISNSLIKFDFLYNLDQYIPLLFITKFINLQEIILSFEGTKSFEDFEKLQYFSFSQLQILDIRHKCPKFEFLIHFLEINGETLKEFYAGERFSVCDHSLNLAVSKFCPNLRKLSVGFKSDELETVNHL